VAASRTHSKVTARQSNAPAPRAPLPNLLAPRWPSSLPAGTPPRYNEANTDQRDAPPLLLMITHGSRI
jgi:hypothetical protein